MADIVVRLKAMDSADTAGELMQLILADPSVFSDACDTIMLYRRGTDRLIEKLTADLGSPVEGSW